MKKVRAAYAGLALMVAASGAALLAFSSLAQAATLEVRAGERINFPADGLPLVYLYGGIGRVVTGSIDGSDLNVQFSSDIVLDAESGFSAGLDESGENQVFARLTGLETFTNLRIEVPGYTFDSLAFNVSGSSNLTVTGTFLNGETQTSAPVDLSSERGVLAYVLGDPNNLFDTNPLTSLLLSGGPFTSFSAFIITGVTAIPGVEPQPVPGPVAGAGLPALLALGGFVWARRRKAAAVA